VTPIILVPLSDSATIPSLSLLLQQGTTPTAVCFQQDILDRAKRSEEEWLPAALEQLRAVGEMKDRSIAGVEQNPASNPGVQEPIILAYSANPALSQSTIAACVNAGAAGVLKPPYSFDTARLVRRMVRAAKEGRVSSVVGLAHPHHSRPESPTMEDEGHRVILPPTALSMGGEHEGERALSSAYRTHRRGTSTGQDLWSANQLPGQSLKSPTLSRSQSHSRSGVPEPISARSTQTPISARTPAFPEYPENDVDPRFASLLVYRPIIEQKRRRSVDVAGLGVALQRAQHAFETVKARSKMSRPDRRITSKDDTSSMPGWEYLQEEETCGGDCPDTQLAELLSAMFYQTQLAIQVDMDDYSQ
jgi:hypothetical protein